ncbi:hypothetical protein APY03_6677 [Variovorax sp. WDL1]|nr:hypothetical protein APY03_6677 [Variovorax sp. WDL1]
MHSVVNPSSRISRAIHIYGGGYFHTPRSEWDPDTLGEKPLDLEAFLRALETKS